VPLHDQKHYERNERCCFGPILVRIHQSEGKQDPQQYQQGPSHQASDGEAHSRKKNNYIGYQRPESRIDFAQFGPTSKQLGGQSEEPKRSGRVTAVEERDN
jgi:hypothetical protein